MEEYLAVKEKNKHLFDTIKSIVYSFNQAPEGNCMWQNKTTNELDCLLYKQHNLYYLAKSANNILEIGFNAGHSALLFLLANNHSKITLFDICEHPYVETCFRFLNMMFPNRLTLIKGNSLYTVAKYYLENPDKKFDLIHVDGYHDPDHVGVEILNVRNLAHKDTIVILDDDDYEPLHELHCKFINNNLMNIHQDANILETQGYKHVVCNFIL